MKNLGKIILFLTLFFTTINAGVTASVEPKKIYSGEEATYILSVTGEDIKRPIINSICGSDVISTSSMTSIKSINLSYEKIYTLSYKFVPRKSCVIDNVEIEIDSKMQKPNAVSVDVKPIAQDLNADFLLSLETSKTELYVGEPFELTLLLKQKRDANAVDSKFIAPDFKGFWIKGQSKPQRGEEGEYITTKIIFKLAPQRVGRLSISPAKIKIASRVGVNQWGTLIPQVKWRTYYSEELTIETLALPNGAKIIGDFTIATKVKSRNINVNEAVNVTVEVLGNGNLEDILSFKPYVQDVNIFEENIVVEGNKLSQKLAFVSDRDFTIPAFKLEYFNTQTQRVEIITTKPIAIKVNGSKEATQELKIKRETPSVEVPKEVRVESSPLFEINNMLILGVFVGGLIIGMGLMSLKSYMPTTTEKKFNLKDEKLLLVKLLPFKDDKDVWSLIERIEKNLYTQSKEALDKKLLKEVIKRYSIS